MKRDLISDIFRSFFFTIDRAIYWLVEISYELFHNLAGIGLLDNSTFERFTSRIYLLLGIFALFKISFALIGMFVNPDSFSDSKTGGGKLIKKVFIVLLLIVFVPTIFKLGFQLQSIILDNNILGTVILGNTTNVEQTTSTFENGGRIISTTIFKAFFRPALKDSNGNIDYSTCINCKREYESNVKDVSVGKFSDFLHSTNKDKMYIFDYNIFISTLAALAAAFLLISFAIDVAIRSVKLTFLQLIAPIPIIMSLDPKKGEEGLKKWISTTVGTYIDLFMRLSIIYFVIFLISEITKNGGNALTLFRYDATGTAVEANNVGVFASVFIIFGLLLFAKEAPNLIYDLLGIKAPSGGFGLNPLKKLSPLAKGAGILGGGILGSAGGALLRGKAAADKNQDTKTVLKQAALGALGGGYEGLKGGIKAGGKGSILAPGMGAASGQYGRYGKTKDVKMSGRADAWLKSKTGQKTKFEIFEKQGKDLDVYANLIKNLDIIANQQPKVTKIQEQITALQNNPRLSSDIKLQNHLVSLKTRLNVTKEAELNRIAGDTNDQYNQLVSNSKKEIDNLVKANKNEVSFKGIEDSSTAFGKLSTMSNIASVNKATIEVNPEYRKAKKEHELAVSAKKDKTG